jgi:uridine kinase
MKQTVKPAPPAQRVTLVAIAGGSGSGKTWLADALRRRLRGTAALLSIDDFYRDLSHLPPARRARVNFDSPAAIDWKAFESALRAIAEGGAPELPLYDFSRHTRAEQVRRWRPRSIVIIEGLWPWVRGRLRRLFALRLYRAAETELRFARRLHRDVRERGRQPADIARQWRAQVEPMFTRHVAPQRRHAHAVLGAKLTPAEINHWARRIRELHRGKPGATPPQPRGS